MSENPPQFLIPGHTILADVRDAYLAYRDIVTAAAARVVIIRFAAGPDAAPGWESRMSASRVSAQQKQRVFTTLGVGVELHVLPDSAAPAQLQGLIAAANTDPGVAAIIVQTPPPRRLIPLLDAIKPAKDIDALGVDSLRPACATADGIARVASPFLHPDVSVAVVGARGFVGSGVTALLQRAGHDPLPLDQGDDLHRLRGVDVVISTTGRAGLLTVEHLHRRHHLVIDSGFVPQTNGPIGDVDPAAAHLPAAITPVPGGIGPVEMAVLAERLVTTLAAPHLQTWAYLGQHGASVTTAAQNVVRAGSQTRAARGLTPRPAGPRRARGGAAPNLEPPRRGPQSPFHGQDRERD